MEAPTYKGVFNFVDGANLNIEYEYDKNGNLVKDSNKKISKIEYNLLNLPTKVTFLSDQSISYLYNAAGTKLRATYRLAPKQIVTNTIDYCGNMIYEVGTLKQVLFDGGYITFIGTTPKYHYYLKDHLGNNRMVVDARGLVKQINHYYPYGGIMGESTNESTQRYKYNGKVFDRMHGLDWYDYGARNYDAAIGRWFNIDMLAEKEPSISPYVYCLNNPMINIDDDGKRSRTALIRDENRYGEWHKCTNTFYRAMLYFSKTTFGRKILADFTPANSTFYGVKGNGKYSNYNLTIYDISISNPQSRTAFFHDSNAVSQLDEDENGKPEFKIVFDSKRSFSDLLETISHEFAGHLYRYEDIIKAYEKNKSYKDSNKEWKKKSQDDDHEHMENTNSTFQQVLRQLLQIMSESNHK